MATWVLPLIVGVLGTLFTIIVLIVAVKMSNATKKVDVLENADLIDCTVMKKFTNGHTDGVIKSVLPRKNGCSLIEFYPTDTPQNRGKIPKPAMQSFIVRTTRISVTPRIEGSAYRNKIRILPRSPADLPRSMRASEEGKALTEAGQLEFIENTFGKGIKAGDEAISSAMVDYARGNITKNNYEQIRELAKNYQNQTNKENSEEKKNI